MARRGRVKSLAILDWVRAGWWGGWVFWRGGAGGGGGEGGAGLRKRGRRGRGGARGGGWWGGGKGGGGRALEKKKGGGVRGRAGEMADAGDFARRFVPEGALDFAAIKEAGGEVVDECVPTAGMGGGEMLDAVTGAAGEGGKGFGRLVGVGAESGEESGV